MTKDPYKNILEEIGKNLEKELEERKRALKIKLFVAGLTLAFFCAAIFLAWIWYDWKLALVLFLGLASASGNASLK